MSAPVDELYFRWLYAQVANPRKRRQTEKYWTLLRKLFTTEYVWLLANDDNRATDGRDLRYEFLSCWGHEAEQSWHELGCSVLEFSIALARRMYYMTDNSVPECFWEMMHNADLARYSDAVEFDETRVEDILTMIVWRTYEPNGRGGFFPLEDAPGDQRRVEVWYQLSAYVLEKMDREEV